MQKSSYVTPLLQGRKGHGQTFTTDKASSVVIEGTGCQQGLKVCPTPPIPPPPPKKSSEKFLSAFFVRYYFVRKIQICFTTEFFYPTQYFLLIFGQNLNNLGASCQLWPCHIEIKLENLVDNIFLYFYIFSNIVFLKIKINESEVSLCCLAV